MVIWPVAVVAPFILAAAYGLYVLGVSGQFKDIEPVTPPGCVRVEGVVGAEDMEPLPDGHSVLIAADDRRAVIAGKPVQGGIYLYDVNTPEVPPRLMTADFKGDLHPHGLGLYTDAAGSTTVFVVNHPGASLFTAPEQHQGPVHTVEVFHMGPDRLIHLDTRFDERLLVSPNDVSPLDATRFYVTNDHGTSDPQNRTMEDYARLRRSHVLFFNGKSFIRVAENLRMANGVHVSADGSRVLVAATTDLGLYTYQIVPETGELNLTTWQNLGTGVDNVSVMANGDLWIAAHPRLLDFVKYAKTPGSIAPTEILHLTPGGDTYTVKQVLMDKGDLISAASVALPVGDTLLAGTVFEPYILRCPLPKSAP